MSKLFKLKNFLTVNATADYLSAVFEEEVTVADVLQLAMEKHIALSINLINHAKARIGKPIPSEQAKLLIFLHYPGGMLNAMSNGYSNPILEDKDLSEEVKIAAHRALAELGLNDDQRQALESLTYQLPEGTTISLGYKGQHIPKKNIVIELDEPMSVPSIEGIWDLPLIGAETLDLHNTFFHTLLGGPEIDLVSLDGTWLVSENNEQWAQLQNQSDKNTKQEESDIESKYYPADGLPEDAVVIIRQKEIQRFVDSLSAAEPKAEKPLKQREETTYLHIIGGLLKQLTDSPRINQSAVSTRLIEEYGTLDGISQSNLDKKFAAANQAIKANS
ncbi:hypothetical protein [Neptunomonas antarctica]|uniref:Uncharacterized protein n=1 Tax=Neptunomonas antarctica TaxID=619304 RepID=A0A1N7M9D8_9GAMM|nr:hypothetical protein [Neptunomonas antarctica]SIS82687.1 hypothetical protein SAMN05421760_105286 [Neptunomonas antarctica]